MPEPTILEKGKRPVDIAIKMRPSKHGVPLGMTFGLFRGSFLGVLRDDFEDHGDLWGAFWDHVGDLWDVLLLMLSAVRVG